MAKKEIVIMYTANVYSQGTLVEKLQVTADNARAACDKALAIVAKKLGKHQSPIKLDGMSNPVMTYGGGLMVEVRRG